MTTELTDDEILIDVIDPEQRAMARERLARRREAEEIAAQHPGMDAGDVEHVLSNLTYTPMQRLSRSMRHARLWHRAV
jgi:hypothetical protein